MRKGDYRQEIKGYEEIKKELEICRKYGIDYTAFRGKKDEVLERLHPKRILLRVSEIIEETRSTRTLRLVSAGKPLPPFLAGQYIAIAAEIDGIKTSRPYSISSPPNQTGYYDITVRQVPDGFVSEYLLSRVKVGDLLEASGPMGNFYYNPLFHGSRQIVIAGGSGITPMMSMIREVTDCGFDRRIHLIYGCRTPDEIIFGREIAERSSRHPNFTYDIVISEPVAGFTGRTGLITAEMVHEMAPPDEDTTYYICGPSAMYDLVVPGLLASGIPRRRIRRELYGPPTRVDERPGWPQEVKRSDRFRVRAGKHEFEAVASEPLLVAFERNHIAVRSGCRSGECSFCRVKLVSGKVFIPEGVPIRASDRKNGYIHSCMAYPLSDLELIL